jgi:hypothetical protein
MDRSFRCPSEPKLARRPGGFNGAAPAWESFDPKSTELENSLLKLPGNAHVHSGQKSVIGIHKECIDRQLRLSRERPSASLKGRRSDLGRRYWCRANRVDRRPE